ncbi:NAD(P)H-dependent oxidoreductase [Shewanella marina]|uniref:NAD(P)H-dependent oxidoreductase n=1 Tax=Shewanella marina TaxID=487319 RepID=UPI00047155C2|nr:NAD(P)H-dependent oxidoreductase [Shewanella marina]
MSILLVSGHPDLQRSVANQAILSELSATEIQCRLLDKLYPDYQIDVLQEQQALLAADVIIFQFPLYWSTYPALMKLWFDEVFTYNFAFGPNGSQLKDKKVILSITCGATAESYAPEQFNFLDINHYLQAAMHPVNAAQMDIVDTILTFEMNSTPDEGGDQQQVMQLAQQHSQRILASIQQYS